MNLKKYSLIFFVSMLAVVSFASPLRGGGSTFGEEEESGSSERGMIERKSPGWFGRPKTDSPEAEMELARELQDKGESREAGRRYLSIVRHWGTSDEASVAQKAYADILFEREAMEKSFREYQYLIRYYAGQFDYDFVLDRQMQIANHLMTVRRGKFLFYKGFVAPERALPYFKQILRNGPTWKHAAEVQFNVGIISEDAGDLNEAVLAYDAVINRHRGHGLVPVAGFRKAVCLMKMSEKAPRDERLLRDALTSMSSFMASYPRNDDVVEARGYLNAMRARLEMMYFERAEFYDRLSKNEKAAIIAYGEFVRQFPASQLAIKAQERIQELKSREGDL